MTGFAVAPERCAYETPTILIIGTSMSAGKTTTARFIIRHLVARGLRVAGAKLTGAGRYRDILSMRDSGAATIVDFVDAGLPSSVCEPERFRHAAACMLSTIEAAGADVAVIEAGASPLEPYNGDLAVEALGDRVCLTVLAASDPYAVLGVQQAFGLKPDLVTGIATNTIAGIDLVQRLTGIQALNVKDAGSVERLGRLLDDAFGVPIS